MSAPTTEGLIEVALNGDPEHDTPDEAVMRVMGQRLQALQAEVARLNTADEFADKMIAIGIGERDALRDENESIKLAMESGGIELFGVDGELLVSDAKKQNDALRDEVARLKGQKDNLKEIYSGIASKYRKSVIDNDALRELVDKVRSMLYSLEYSPIDTDIEAITDLINTHKEQS